MGVTIRDVANLAGTSLSAVSATLNGNRHSTIRVSEATRERIYEAATQLGYVSNPIAKSLATGKTAVLGLMLPYADAFLDRNPFSNLVMSGIMKEVVKSRYNLMLYTATSGISYDEAAQLIDSRVEGILLVMPPEGSAVFEKCHRRGLPYVSILRPPIDGGWTVNADDYAGGRIAAEHLLSLGHRRIAHLVGHREVMTAAPRRRGFLDAMADAGVEVPRHYLIPSGFSHREGKESIQKFIGRYRDDMPTALFACNDMCADGAIQGLFEAGFAVPDDVAIVGFDDTWYSTMVQPSLTSVSIPIEEMGRLATRMLIDRLQGKVPADLQPMLKAGLTVRASCGAFRQQLIEHKKFGSG